MNIRKLHYNISLLIALSSTFLGGASNYLMAGPNTAITIRDVTTPDNPSVQRLVQAYLDFDMEEIVVQFNASVGNEVTVTITSLTGATVSMVMCDSDLESLVSLPIPPKGAYILRVESATYQGEGTFTVQ